MGYRNIRKMGFGGTFYPNDREQLIRFFEKGFADIRINDELDKAYSYVAPHAGYMYSGKTALYTYLALSKNKGLKKLDSFIIIGPNHTGIGPYISVSERDWRTPFGDIKNDHELSKKIAHSLNIDTDETAHSDEHSIEVQLPMLKYIVPEKKASFICMGDQSINSCKSLFSAIRESSKDLKRNVLIIASSDLNHYESAKTAKSKDKKLMDLMEKLDYKGFNKIVNEVNDTACGYGPITVAMMFAKDRGAKKGVILNYSNSGDITKDYQSVVAYSSVAFI